MVRCRSLFTPAHLKRVILLCSFITLTPVPFSPSRGFSMRTPQSLHLPQGGGWCYDACSVTAVLVTLRSHDDPGAVPGVRAGYRRVGGGHGGAPGWFCRARSDAAQQLPEPQTDDRVPPAPPACREV